MLAGGQDRGHRVHHAVAVGREAYRHRVMHRLARRPWFGLRYTVSDLLRRPFARRLLLGTAICVSLAILGVLGLWWRLSSGPIELELATPWLKAAIEENFGGNHSVVVGGTQLERDEKGRTSLRLRDIVVRDVDGAVVASAPKAEILSAPKCRCGLKPTAALRYLLALTNALSRRLRRRPDRRSSAHRV